MNINQAEMQLVGAISHGHGGEAGTKRERAWTKGPPFSARCLGLQMSVGG